MATPPCPKKATGAANKEEKMAARCYLPDKYDPHEQDVLIGRGRRVDNHKGNHRFKGLIRAHVVAYYNAQTKTTKTSIILRIFQDIKRTAQAEGGAGFIKQESSSKRWFVIDDSSARISIAQAFRDCLAGEYKSSKLYKQQKRKEQGRCFFEGQPSSSMYDLVKPADALARGRGSNVFSGCMPMPLPPPLVPMVSSDGHDLSGRIRGMFCNASRVIMTDKEDFIGNPAPLPDDHLFTSLYTAVGFDMNLTTDPFEPTPMAEVKQGEMSWESWSAAFPSFGLQKPDMTSAMMYSSSCDSTQLNHSPQKWDGSAQTEDDHRHSLPTIFSQEDLYQVFDTASLSEMREALRSVT